MSGTRDMGHCKERTYSKVPDAFRKGTERGSDFFVILIEILQRHCKLLYKDNLGLVMKTCIVLHKKIVEYEVDGYDSGIWALQHLGDTKILINEGQKIVWESNSVTSETFGSGFSIDVGLLLGNILRIYLFMNGGSSRP